MLYVLDLFAINFVYKILSKRSSVHSSATVRTVAKNVVENFWNLSLSHRFMHSNLEVKFQIVFDVVIVNM